jgi:hypothetical protein
LIISALSAASAMLMQKVQRPLAVAFSDENIEVFRVTRYAGVSRKCVGTTNQKWQVVLKQDMHGLLVEKAFVRV